MINTLFLTLAVEPAFVAFLSSSTGKHKSMASRAPFFKFRCRTVNSKPPTIPLVIVAFPTTFLSSRIFENFTVKQTSSEECNHCFFSRLSLFFLLALPAFLCQCDFQAYGVQRKVCLASFHPNVCKFRQVRFQKLAGYTQHLRWQQLENGLLKKRNLSSLSSQGALVRY